MATDTQRVIDDALAKSLLPGRAPDAHKWGVGGVIVVAGSPSYPGAAVLASRAAGRAGAGIVLLATSRSVISAVAAAIPEVAFVPLPETESSSGARHAAELIREKAEKARSLVIGPGLGDDDASHGLLGSLFGFGERSQAVRERLGFGGVSAMNADASGAATETNLTGTDIKIVLDADALNWLARQPDWWDHVPPQRLVLTPHVGEMGRLLDRSTDDILADPVDAARTAARTWNQVVLLKGERAVVTDGAQVFVADSGSGALATAGSGDVLAGTTGALLAQTGSPLEAAALATFLGPRAASAVATRFGVLGVIATDLPDAIAAELAKLAG